MLPHRRILVIDLGSQTTNLIARRIRDAGVMTEVLPHTTTADQIKKLDPYGMILSGSPFSLDETDAPQIDEAILGLEIPILGICFGLYVLASHIGGTIIGSEKKEYGPTDLHILTRDVLFEGLPKRDIKVWMNHAGQAAGIENVALITASTDQCINAAFSKGNFYAVQFHPEVEHTEYGQQILENFVFKICKAEKNWKLESWLEDKMLVIKSTFGDKKAICAVSGGVDSTVAAVLCAKALQSNLYCIFVDTGLMRANEAAEVQGLLAPYGLNFRIIKAEVRFLKLLESVTDPEEKRKLIGHEYVAIFEEEANKIGQVEYLIQGTIYSDKIESSKTSGLSSNIKSHHNVGGLPDKMNLQVFEPLDELFKDEVRKIGTLLGLPKSITNRHPFPGPGLAIQILGDVTKEKLEIVRQADAILIEEIKIAGLYDKIGEAFTNFVGVKTTGVKGDAKAYEWLLAIRAVDPSDLMTSNWSRIPHDLLSKIAFRITSEVPGVNRVVYDITTKPPATIRWE